MSKIINLDHTLFELINEHPELLEILYDFGFTQIKALGMLNTAGRFMTLRMGCDLRKLSLENLSIILKKLGYTLKEGQ
jgi:uncharacterized protein